MSNFSGSAPTDVQATLANVPWDLVIVDEAHHMAGYANHNTLAYRLGQVLSRQSRHLILATATPHKGDPQNFLKLLQLLDSGIHDPAIVQQKAAGQRGSPLMLRRLKEEMVTFNGERLFQPRVVETRLHSVFENPPELALYSALTEYVHKTYRAAERLGGRERVNVQFAMAMLQRRMGSSFAALEQSLHRRRDSLLRSDSDLTSIRMAENEDDLAEAERWAIEQQLELATAARTKHEREKEAGEIEILLRKLDEVRQSGIETKVVALQKILKDANIDPGNGEKLLVFTEFKDTLDFLRRVFGDWGFTVTQIDGSMTHDLRRRAEKAFSENTQVMVATEAAGEGINLQFCAHMVNYDLPWVPTRLEQRMGRIHRYGQKRTARIYNLAAADTREGNVLVGLMDRLSVMRGPLGDQVFDVLSVLVSDVDLEKLLTNVALSAPTEASQEEALQRLWEAVEAGAARYKQWEEHPFAIDPEQFKQMQAASQHFRLTPEYAQHFFVDTLRQLKENPTSAAGAHLPAGDADVLHLQLFRADVARSLGVEAGRLQRLSFHADVCKQDPQVGCVALGTPLMDGALRLAEAKWGDTLHKGAIFLDPRLAPGQACLLWFVSAHALDGNAQPVESQLFAIRQTPDTMSTTLSSALIDLVPATETFDVPQSLLGMARDPQPVIQWSLSHQQLPFLAEVQARRETVTGLRREPILADARAAWEAADSSYQQQVFAGEPNVFQVEQAVQAAKHRLEEQRRHFEREAACSLGAPTIVGVAAVLSLHAEPAEDMADLRPEIAAAAQKTARAYEEVHGRIVMDVSGEHHEYPYDLHSKGPGGVRCIEVKGTTTGKITLSENERRAAKRLGASYYLYVVEDPLGEAHLSIVNDPLAKMAHDATLYSGVRYVFNGKTWRAAADKDTTP